MLKQENSLSAEDRLLIYFKAAMVISAIAVITSLAFRIIIPAIIIASLVGVGYLATKALTTKKSAKVDIEEEITKKRKKTGQKKQRKSKKKNKRLLQRKLKNKPLFQ